MEAGQQRLTCLTAELETGKQRLASLTAELEAGQQRLEEQRLGREAGETKLKELQQKLDSQEKQQVCVTGTPLALFFEGIVPRDEYFFSSS